MEVKLRRTKNPKKCFYTDRQTDRQTDKYTR